MVVQINKNNISCFIHLCWVNILISVFRECFNISIFLYIMFYNLFGCAQIELHILIGSTFTLEKFVHFEMFFLFSC